MDGREGGQVGDRRPGIARSAALGAPCQESRAALAERQSKRPRRDDIPSHYRTTSDLRLAEEPVPPKGPCREKLKVDVV